MKYITFVVPCYNSQDYMKRCIDSLLEAGDNIEIIIVNDGSTDNTEMIGRMYEKKYPSIVRLISKDNGGHGSGVNAGIENATGRYFKVVDSDDWLDKSALKKLMNTIIELCTIKEKNKKNIIPDLLVCNYVYDHIDKGFTKRMSYSNVFESNVICTWNDMGHFMPSQYLIMHSLIFRTKILRKSGVKLPEHTFYVDNILAFMPLPYVRTILYLDLDLYHYYIGRDDQSVNEKVMMGRVDQQIRVTKIISQGYDIKEIYKKNPKLANYMFRNISMMMTISSVFLLLANTKESLIKRRNLWDFVRKNDINMYKNLRFKSLCGWTYLPGKIGRYIALTGYKFAKRVYSFS